MPVIGLYANPIELWDGLLKWQSIPQSLVQADSKLLGIPPIVALTISTHSRT
jgi:hypothetical protein